MTGAVVLSGAVACGGGGSTSSPASGSVSSSGASPSVPTSSTSAVPSLLNVRVGPSLYGSSLGKGSDAFNLAPPAVTEVPDGLQLSVSANKETVATDVVHTSVDNRSLPMHLEIGVRVTPATSPNLIYGIGCEGAWADFNDQYAAVTDAAGSWQIVAQESQHTRVLAKGSTTIPGGDIQLNLACVPLSGSTTRLSFAIDGKAVDSLEAADKNMPTSNGFQLLAVDPGTGTSGIAVFHDLDVRSASAS